MELGGSLQRPLFYIHFNIIISYIPVSPDTFF
jgi:hypothetical protein